MNEKTDYWNWTQFSFAICEKCNEGFNYSPRDNQDIKKLEAHAEETGHVTYRIENKLLLSKVEKDEKTVV